MSNLNVLMTNTSAMFTNRQLGITGKEKAKSTEKLSSGYRINRAADDAAGLTISEKMRFYIRGLNQGVNNIQDGVSLCQIADGALNEVHDMIHRLKELAVHGANGTLTDEDREALDSESGAIKNEIKRVFKTTEFNDHRIFVVPYSLDVSGSPQDIQVYNLDLSNSGNPKYGGVEIDNIRYTWNELGLDRYLSDDGNSFDFSGGYIDRDDGKRKAEVKVRNPESGEMIHLRVTNGENLPNISRVYEWDADDNGININGLRAATWEELGVSEAYNEPGEISFVYRDTIFSFDQDGGSRKDIIKGINGDNMDDDSVFSLSLGGVNSGTAVNDMKFSMTLTVTNSNKSLMDDDYRITANERGITIASSSDPDHDTSASYSFFNWDQFEDKDGKGFRINDFGLENHPNTSAYRTFDHDAEYRYKDNTTGLTFTFRITDESSREAIINAFSNAEIQESYSAPGKVYLKKSDGAYVNSLTDSAGDSVRVTYVDGIGGNTLTNMRIQKAMGRNFDNTDAKDLGIRKTVRAGEIRDTGTRNSSSCDFAADSSSDSTVYYKIDDNTYGVYKRTSETGTETETITDITYKTQEFKYDYTASVFGSVDNGSSSMSTITARYTETKKTTNEYVYTKDTYARTGELRLEGGVWKDNENNVVNIDPASVVDNVTNRTTRGSLKNTGQTTDTVCTNLNSSANDTVTVKDSNGNILYKLGYTNKLENMINLSKGSGSSSQTVSFKPDSRASVSFSASPNGYDSGNKVASPILNTITSMAPKKKLDIQAGDDADNVIHMEWSGMSLASIGLSGTSMLTQDSCRAAMDQITHALNIVSTERSTFGAYQNSLEHAIAMNKNTAENLQAAESAIRDTDMAEEAMKNARMNIIEQAGQAMLTQANQQRQGIINLLG